MVPGTFKRTEEEVWLIPLWHLLDQWEIYKQFNGLAFVSYAQIAIAKVPTTIRINPASAFLLNFSLNTK